MQASWPLSPPKLGETCKVCGGHAPALGSCDVNSGGPPGAAQRLSLGQVLVYYRCTDCGLMFASQLDSWQPQDFSQHIYNAQYIEVDPDYIHERPWANAQMLLNLLGNQLNTFPPKTFALLDFGAGSGLLAQHLRSRGLLADSEDPYSQLALTAYAAPPSARYDMVCAFEVIEHSPTPLQTLAQIKARLKPGGCALISTLLQPDNIATLGCDWWYCAPRNGHISLFSARSLEIALSKAGVTSWRSLSAGLHVAYF